MKTLPEYYVIKKDLNNPLWMRYIKWLKILSGKSFDGTAEYYGFAGTYDYQNYYKEFINNPTLITLEEWDECINGFTLPEAWHVIVTKKNKEILSKWYGTSLNTLHLVGMVKWNDGKITKGFNPKEDVKSDTFTFGKEITFEQFKKYVLKQNEMKEIIAYKLIKPEYEKAACKLGNTDLNSGLGPGYAAAESTIKALKDADVLDLWFSPIYKEEEPKYKVGDWVITSNYSSKYDNKPLKIIRISNDTYCYFIPTKKMDRNDNFAIRHIKRYATPEEIKEAGINLLLEEAKERYPVGTRFNSPNNSGKYYQLNQEVEIAEFEWYDNEITVKLTSKNSEGIVYKDGKWAEIITSPDIEINGYECQFFDDYVKFGCVEVSKATVLTIDTLLRKHHVNLTDKEDEIKEIAEYYTKK